MTTFEVVKQALTLVGGLCLFLFGMNLMGQALERRAGSSLKMLLSKLTTSPIKGFLTGLVVTSIIQSSSATTVMVVGFVNSGLMNLRQAINVIIGANVGTTVTGWILAMENIPGEAALILNVFKPSFFTPILALIGIVMYMFFKASKNKDTGVILLGFAVLMFGMEAMSGSVSGLKDSPEFQQMFTMFENPILGVLVGAVLTGIIQSSSASVGILQVLSDTGNVTIGATIPIIMGQAIGTCVTALLSCFGTNRNAKSAAMAHLTFNVLGTAICLTAYALVDAFVSPALFSLAADRVSIAIVNTVFKLIGTVMFLPLTGFLEKVSLKLVPEKKNTDAITELDERLLQTPAVAIERCHVLALEMAEDAFTSLKNGIVCLKNYDPALVESIKKAEDKTDHYEDIIGTYLVKLSTLQISDADSAEAGKLLKIIGDLERISDHAKNLVDSAEEMKAKGISFSGEALTELNNLCDATIEIIDLAHLAFSNNDMVAASTVEPLEQIIDKLKKIMRQGHITRLQQGACSIETGFVWSDIITNLERVSDHCSNIAGCVIDAAADNLNLHESLRAVKIDSPVYKSQYEAYAAKYLA